MRTVRAWMLRLKGMFFSKRDEQDFLEQIQADIELHTEEGVRAGMNPEEARRAALVKFGGVDAATEAWRERRGIPFLETLVRDVTYSLRVLGRSKGWASVFILSLALGIGANTALFSAANILLFRNLPVADAEDLVVLQWRGQNNVVTNFSDYGYVPGSFVPEFGEEFSFDNLRGGATGSYPTFRRLVAANKTMEHLFAVGPGPTVNVIVDGQGNTASSQFVSGEFYSTLKVAPAAGRLIQPADDESGAPPVAVISHGYWQKRFGGNPNIVGKQVRINAVAYTIVGVSGARFPDVISNSPESHDISIPLANEPAFKAPGEKWRDPGESRLEQATDWWLVMMGRLKPGVTPAQVQANLGPVYEQAGRDGWAALLATLSAENLKEFPAGWGTSFPKLAVVSGSRGAYDPDYFRKTLVAVLSILVGVVLAIICANLVNLSLAFTTSRHREIAIRQAMGASRGRLVRQVLTEHLVVALLGGAASLLVAYLCQDLVRLVFTAEFDWTVVGFAFAAATATGVIIGILPALRASRISNGSLAVGVRERRSRLATGLLVTQVALSLALLVGAGLFVRTLINLKNVNPGIDVDHLAVFGIDPSFNQYDRAKTEALYQELTTNLRALPGVSSVTFSSEPLLSTGTNFSPVWSDRAESGYPPVLVTGKFDVGNDFFETTGIPFRLGRDFTSHDNAAAPQVAIINEALARALFGNEYPIGRRFGGDSSDAEKELEVIGVVANAWHTSFRATQPLAVYRPHLQSIGGSRTFEVRTLQAPEDLVPSIRQVVQRVDAALPILELSTLNSATGQQWRQERVIALASGALGGLAIAVSMIGLFGLMSYAVTRRTTEIAIRMALGAEGGRVLQSILREYLLLVVVGVLIGLGIALSTSRFLKTLLFGLAPHDPLVVGCAILLMLVVAGIAAYMPARRAAKVDPMVSLRHE